MTRSSVATLLLILTAGSACSDDAAQAGGDTDDVGTADADADAAADADVAADVDDDADVGGPYASFVVTIDYTSQVQPLVAVDVLMLEEVGCDTIVDEAWPPTTVPLTRTRMLVQADGTFGDANVSVPDQTFPTALVAYAFTASVADANPAPWASAVGCVDVDPLAPRTATPVTLSLEDRWPHIEGTYSFEGSTFDDFLLPGVSDATIAIISEFADDTGAALLRVLATSACAASACGDSWASQEPWDLLFDEEDDGDVTLTTVGALVAATIDGALDGGLAALGSDMTARELFAPTADAINGGFIFGLAGTLFVTGDGGDGGRAEDVASMTFGTVRFMYPDGQWHSSTLSDDALLVTGPFDVSVGVSDNEAWTDLTGEEDAYVVGLQGIELRVDADLLLLLAYETLGLLEPLSELVDGTPTIASAFAQLLDCADLHDRITCEGEFASLPDCDATAAPVADVIEAACDVLLAGLDDSAWLDVLAPTTSSTYELSTPGAGCLANLGRDLAEPALLHRVLSLFGQIEFMCVISGVATDAAGTSQTVSMDVDRIERL